MSKRKKYDPAFKARVALAALSGEKTITEWSSEFGVHQTFIDTWAKQLKESAPDIFSGEPEAEESIKRKGIQKIDDKIGQLTKEERDFLLKSFGK